MSSKTTSQTAIFNRRESEARSYCRGIDRLFVSARGSEMTDAKGHSYIDFLAGCSSLNYGHNDPDMKHALIEHLTAVKTKDDRQDAPVSRIRDGDATSARGDARQCFGV